MTKSDYDPSRVPAPQPSQGVEALEAAILARLGPDQIDADYASELRTSRNRWRRETQDLRDENKKLLARLTAAEAARDAAIARAERLDRQNDFLCLQNERLEAKYEDAINGPNG